MKITELFSKKNADNKAVKDNSIALKGGAYSVTLTVVVLAILIAVNILVSALPKSVTRFDISAAKLYSISSNTKAVVSALEEDVTIYWVVQADQDDEVISNLLSKYEAVSDKINVVKKNPDEFPTFTSQYTSDDVQNNSLIVECGDRYKYISYDSIYITDIDYSTYSRSTSFDGEGAITSAIDYCISDDLPKIYVLSGHGEAELPSEFASQISRANMETVSLSLLSENEVPEDASCVLMFAPSSDISEEELDILKSYVYMGGKLLVIAGPVEDSELENVYELVNYYGVEAAEGIVIDADNTHYAFSMPYILLPDITSHEITDPLIEENYKAVMPIARGLTITDSAKGVTALLTTSDTAYSKAAGYKMETLEKEEGDTEGQFALAVAVETTAEGKLVFFSSSDFLSDMYDSYSSGANVNLAMNTLSYLVGETDGVSIRPKSLDYNYLTISSDVASMLKTVMIAVIPLTFIVIGICVVITRRRMRHE